MYLLLQLARVLHGQDPCSTLHFIQMANSSETRVTDIAFASTMLSEIVEWEACRPS